MFEMLSYSQGTALAVTGITPLIFMLVMKKNGLWLYSLSVLGACVSVFGWANALNVILS